MGDVKCELAEKVVHPRLVEVYIVVIVALEAVPAIFNGDDPVHDYSLHLFTVVCHHIANAVFACTPNYSQVTGVKIWLHADPMGYNIRGIPADRGW